MTTYRVIHSTFGTTDDCDGLPIDLLTIAAAKTFARLHANTHWPHQPWAINQYTIVSSTGSRQPAKMTNAERIQTAWVCCSTTPGNPLPA